MMTMSRRSLLGLTGAALLPGCSLLGLEEEEPDGPFVEEAPDGTTLVREPVVSVERIEIGRTASGLALSAFGVAPGIGYARPVLVPRRDGAPGRDGVLDFDFLATPPDPGRELGQGSLDARRLRADILLDANRLRGARGLRVHALSGGVEMRF